MPKQQKTWLKKKLLMACGGFALGILVGMGIAIYMDRDGMQP